MAIQDLQGRDYFRLAKALSEARTRNDSVIPDAQALIGALKGVASNPKPMKCWSDLGELLVPILGESIRPGVELLRSVLSEKYGQKYTQDLWLRFSTRSSDDKAMNDD